MGRVVPLLLLVLWGPPDVFAQAPDEAVAQAGEVGGTVADDDFRDTAGYSFPALSKTVREMQNLAHAMTLRDYCADDRISDAFVRRQLARFSILTGRDENCRSLLDY